MARHYLWLRKLLATVDTLDSIRSLSLKFKQLLIREPHLIVHWNGVDFPVILGLSHEDVSDAIDPAVAMQILSMQRRIIVEDGNLHLQGVNGADLPFMDIKLDFKQHDSQEYSLLARGNIAAAVQPEFVLALRYYGDLADYTHAMLEFELKTSNLQLAELFNFYPEYSKKILEGGFSDFDLAGVVQNGSVRSVTSDFMITGLTVGQDTNIKSGSGHIEFKPGENKSSLQLTQLVIENKGLYTQPITVDAISANVVYNELENNAKQITLENTRIKVLEMELRPEVTATISGNKLDTLDLNAKLADVTLSKAMALLPDQLLSSNLCAWLQRALLEGDLDHVNVKFAEQKLRWSLAFKGAELKFSPAWPSIYDIDANLIMHDGDLSIAASRAIILGTEMRSLHTKFSEYNDKPYAMISIAGSADTTLETSLNYIQQTPLADSLGAKLEALNPQGPVELALLLNVNVAKPDLAIDVAGTLEFKQATAKLSEVDLPIDNINGTLRFTNQSFVADNIRFNLLQQPATATVAMHPKKKQVMNLTVQAPIKISALKKLLPKTNFDHINGMTNVQAVLEIPVSADHQDKLITFNSDLQGVEITYPQPFSKTAHTKMPLQLQYLLRHNRADLIKFKFANLDGILFIKDQTMQGGRVAIATKLDSAAETNSMLIAGKLEKLVWSDWAPLFSKSTPDTLPIEADLHVGVLNFYGEEYRPVHLKYNSVRHELYVDSPVLTGTIAINQDADAVAIKLDKLNVPATRVKSNALIDLLREKRAAGKLPVLQFYCAKLQFNKHDFHKISLELLPRTYGYEIVNFSINNENLILQAQGSWQMDNKPITTLTGNINSQNFGKVMTEWGYPNSISRGKGELNFTIQWDGGPMDFDVLKVEGTSHLDLRAGSLTSVNPGIGRIIGLLSLDSIQRRLQLDFSDVISRGFAFDKLVADIKIDPGSVKSDNILINSPSAKIELAGKNWYKIARPGFYDVCNAQSRRRLANRCGNCFWQSSGWCGNLAI